MKREMHLGDPCVFCDQAWDQIASGECPGRPGLEESADLRASIWALQDRYLRLYEQMEVKVAAAVAAERERCAEKADEIAATFLEGTELLSSPALIRNARAMGAAAGYVAEKIRAGPGEGEQGKGRPAFAQDGPMQSPPKRRPICP